MEPSNLTVEPHKPTDNGQIGCYERLCALNEAVIIAETDSNGTITYVNQNFCAISGYSAQELLGANHRLINSGMHAPAFFHDLWKTIKRGDIWQGEICNRAKAGHLYWVSATIVPVIDTQTRKPKKFIAVRFDITQRKAMEQALYEKKEAARKIFENTSNPVILIKNNAIIDCNVAAYEQLGYATKAQFLTLKLEAISPLYQPDGQLSEEKAHKMTDIALRVGHHHYDWMHQHANGACFDSEVSLTVIRVNNELLLHKQWRDISERRQLTAALYAEKERTEVTLASTLSAINEAIIVTDDHSIVTFLNPVAIKLTGWPMGEAVGKSVKDIFCLVNETTRHTLHNPVTQILKKHSHKELTSAGVLIARDGAEYHIESSVAPLYLKNNKLLGAVLVFNNVTEKRQLIKDVHWQAWHDVLTGLPNRALLADRFARALNNAQRQHHLLGVCIMDLDEFKPINETYGHEVGNRLLIEVTQRISAVVRGEDTLARLGGDEFALIIGNLHDVNEMHIFLRRILDSIAKPYQIEGHLIQISASIGATIYPLDNVDADTLLRHADHAMFDAKQLGRNGYHLFDVQHAQSTQHFYQTRERIRQALNNNELCLYYQPKVNMRTREVIGMEALLRWQHPERGLIPPLEFLPLVEHCDLIIDIGEWVIAEALKQITLWQAEQLSWTVSVNIAARHFQHPEFLQRLTAILAHYPNAPTQLLELEILESTALNDIEQIRRLIHACQGLGVSFSLDDFGTGYASLSYLKRLPADTLKVDQSFVQDMLDNKEDLALIKAVIGLAQVFNRQVIAEGVESPEHGVLLMRLGCDLAQGYSIAPPMVAHTVSHWFSQFVPDPSWALWSDVQWEFNDFPLLVAQYDHLKWVKKLIDAVNGKLVQPIGCEQQAHECRFGQWYASYGTSHYKHLPEFVAVTPIHSKIHQLGSRIIDLCLSGDFKLSLELSQNLLNLNDKFIVQLTALQQAVAGANKHFSRRRIARL